MGGKGVKMQTGILVTQTFLGGTAASEAQILLTEGGGGSTLRGSREEAQSEKHEAVSEPTSFTNKMKREGGL